MQAASLPPYIAFNDAHYEIPSLEKQRRKRWSRQSKLLSTGLSPSTFLRTMTHLRRQRSKKGRCRCTLGHFLHYPDYYPFVTPIDLLHSRPHTANFTALLFAYKVPTHSQKSKKRKGKVQKSKSKVQKSKIKVQKSKSKVQKSKSKVQKSKSKVSKPSENKYASLNLDLERIIAEVTT